jgi:putative transposase
VGPLLAAPPALGELGPALDRLAAQTWRHSGTGEPLRFARSTLERWYYAARQAPQDPVEALRRRVRKDAGSQPSLPLALRDALRAQWQAHPGWTVHATEFADYKSPCQGSPIQSHSGSPIVSQRTRDRVPRC